MARAPIFPKFKGERRAATNGTNADVDDFAELKTKCPAIMVSAMLDELYPTIEGQTKLG